MRTFECLNPVYFFLHEDSYVPHSCHLKLLRIYYNTALGSSPTWEMTFRHEMQKYMWHIACLHLLSFWDNMSSYQVSVVLKVESANMDAPTVIKAVWWTEKVRHFCFSIKKSYVFKQYLLSVTANARQTFFFVVFVFCQLAKSFQIQLQISILVV